MNFNFDCPYYYRSLLVQSQHEHGHTMSQTTNRILTSYAESLECEPIVASGIKRVHVELTEANLSFLHETAKTFCANKSTVMLLAFQQYRDFQVVLESLNRA